MCCTSAMGLSAEGHLILNGLSPAVCKPKLWNFSQRVLEFKPSGNVNTDDQAPVIKAVYDVMKSGRWMTLAEIAFASGYPEASVSARIRDLHRLMKLAYQKKKSKDGKLYEYRLTHSPSQSRQLRYASEPR